MSKNEIPIETTNVKTLISGGEQETHIKEINMVRNLQAMEDHLHQDIAYSVKPMAMIQAFVKLLSIPRIIKLSNVKSIMHATCVSKQVSIKLILVRRL